MNKVKAIVEEIAKIDVNVLIKGESGTGKQLVGLAIHQGSRHRGNPFMKVNCAAIPKALLDSELFGYEKGVFAGAQLQTPGKFELANGGTILLDEIGEMDAGVQAKLFQVLQEGQFYRLGGNETISINTTVIATTEDHLDQAVAEGLFREDLFHRINTMSITLPPLRDRREQILPLAELFCDVYSSKYGKPKRQLSPAASQALQGYHWPGNMRELENVVRQLVLDGEKETLGQALLHHRAGAGAPPGMTDLSSVRGPGREGALNLTLLGKRAAELAERRLIQDTLQEIHWNRKEAAKLLHISYKALLYKITKYGLNQADRLEKAGGDRDGRVWKRIDHGSGNGVRKDLG